MQMDYGTADQKVHETVAPKDVSMAVQKDGRTAANSALPKACCLAQLTGFLSVVQTAFPTVALMVANLVLRKVEN